MNSLSTLPIPVRIMLVDDDIDDCMFFKDALTETGINTKLQIATKCTNILDLIGTSPEKFPDLIFLDLNMPFVSGLECLAIIRKVSYLDKIPVIIYSTSAVKQEVDETFEGGADLYLQKPSGFQLLVIALRKILQIDWSNQMKDRSRSSFIYRHIQPFSTTNPALGGQAA